MVRKLANTSHGIVQVNLAMLAIHIRMDIAEGWIHHFLRGLRELLVQSQRIVPCMIIALARL